MGHSGSCAMIPGEMCLDRSAGVARLWHTSGEVKLKLKPFQRMTFVGFLVWLILIVFSDATSLAQTSVKPPEGPLTLDRAIDFALANYPAIRASMQRAIAAKEGVSLSRTAYLPRTDLLWQSNRATRNNI